MTKLDAENSKETRHKAGNILGIIVGLFMITFLLPPFVICKGGILPGNAAVYLKAPANHIYKPKSLLKNPHYHKTSDFDNFYFINFRFWEKLYITEIEYEVKYGEETQQPEIRNFTPFIYIVEQNKKGEMLNSFYVKRGLHYWVFDYYYASF